MDCVVWGCGIGYRPMKDKDKSVKTVSEDLTHFLQVPTLVYLSLTAPVPTR